MIDTTKIKMKLTDAVLINIFRLKTRGDIQRLDDIKKAVESLIDLQVKYPKEDFFLCKDSLGNFKVVGEVSIAKRLLVSKWSLYGGSLELSDNDIYSEELKKVMYA